MEKNYEIVDSLEKLSARLEKIKKAQKVYATYTEEQVDKIFLNAALAANKARIELAKMAVDNDISIEKVKKLLVYCHAMKNIGKNYTIKEADKLSNATVISDTRKYVDYLKATRSKEELAALEKRFKEIGKGQ